jgi:hypothetical protein
MSTNQTQTTYKAHDGKIVVIHTPGPFGIVSIMPSGGATASRVSLIVVQPGKASVVWGDNTYHYDVDAFDVMGAFASTRSVGKTANFIKASGTLVAKFDENNNEVMVA